MACPHTPRRIMFFAHSPPAPAVDALRLSHARYRAQALFLKVALLDRDGEVFAPERLHLLQLLRAALGTKRAKAGDLLADALAGSARAERRVLDLLAQVAYDAA